MSRAQVTQRPQRNLSTIGSPWVLEWYRRETGGRGSSSCLRPPVLVELEGIASSSRLSPTCGIQGGRHQRQRRTAQTSESSCSITASSTLMPVIFPESVSKPTADGPRHLSGKPRSSRPGSFAEPARRRFGASPGQCAIPQKRHRPRTQTGRTHTDHEQVIELGGSAGWAALPWRRSRCRWAAAGTARPR